MIKLRHLVVVFVFSLFAFAQQPEVEAGERNGNQELCRRPWTSTGENFGPLGPDEVSRPVNRSTRITSECTVIKVESLFEEISKPSASEFVNFLNEVQKDLWDSKRLPDGILYRYNLKVINDWSKNTDFNLSDWEVTHSPYTWTSGSFSIKMSACSQAIVQFLSPWAPEQINSLINLGVFNDNDAPISGSGKGWGTISVGKAAIVVPVGYQYFPESFRIEPLPANEAKTKACSTSQ